MTIDVRGMAPLLQVFDMSRSLAFYRDVLGFEVVSTAGTAPHFGWVLLRLRDLELMLNTAHEPEARPDGPEPGRVAAHGDTTLFFGCPDLESVYQRVQAHGVPVEPPAQTGYGFRALSLHDPDGYGLSFHWPQSAESIADWQRRYGFDPAAAMPHRDR